MGGGYGRGLNRGLTENAAGRGDMLKQENAKNEPKRSSCCYPGPERPKYRRIRVSGGSSSLKSRKGVLRGFRKPVRSIFGELLRWRVENRKLGS